jgi:hypothetical protein
VQAHFPEQIVPRPLRCYAVSQGWLLPSPPLGGHGHTEPFSLNESLRTLPTGRGCVPLVSGPSHPETVSRWTKFTAFAYKLGLSGIRSFRELGSVLDAPHPTRALPPERNQRGGTSIHFAENQLSPGLVGLSPLPTAHPRLLRQTWVQPSAARTGWLQLGHEEITWFRVSSSELNAHIRALNSGTIKRSLQTRFRYTFTINSF